MTSVLVDTTSLMELVRPRDFQDSLKYYDRWKQPGTEAIVLFDNIFFDGPSFVRNEAYLPNLSKLYNVGTFINNEHGEEDLRYRQAISDLVARFSKNPPELTDLMRRHINEMDTIDLRFSSERDEYYYPSGRNNRIQFAPSTYWRDIRQVLGGPEGELVQALEALWGNDHPFSGAALAAIIRALYYMASQQKLTCHLSIHPMKGQIFSDEGDKASGHEGTARNILDMFDQKVRAAYLKRKQEWLGGRLIEIPVPMLTEYVSRKSPSVDGYLDQVLELRYSREASLFRLEISELIEALERGDGIAVDLTLKNLNEAADVWQRSLSGRAMQVKQKIGVKLPFVDLSTDLQLPLPALNRKGSNILQFLHSIASAT